MEVRCGRRGGEDHHLLRRRLWAPPRMPTARRPSTPRRTKLCARPSAPAAIAPACTATPSRNPLQPEERSGSRRVPWQRSPADALRGYSHHRVQHGIARLDARVRHPSLYVCEGREKDKPPTHPPCREMGPPRVGNPCTIGDLLSRPPTTNSGFYSARPYMLCMAQILKPAPRCRNNSPD